MLPPRARLHSETSGWCEEQEKGFQEVTPSAQTLTCSSLEPLRPTAPCHWGLGPFALQGGCCQGQLLAWTCEHVHWRC